MSDNTNLDNQALEEKVYDNLLETFLNMGITDEDLLVIEKILALPDDSFDIISQQVLDEMEDALESPTVKIAMAESLKKDNMSAEEVIQVFQEVIKQFNKEEQRIGKKRVNFLKQYFGIIINIIQNLEGLSNRVISIPIEYCREVEHPKYASEGDAGMDLYSPEEYTINPGETIIIPTGIKCALPKGYAFLIQPRSGQSVKTKLRIANTPGLIDSGYRDEIGVIVENINPEVKNISYDFDGTGQPVIKSILHGESYTIHKGERFAQMRLVAVPTAALYEVESVGEIGEDRGGGFGHTGV